MTAITIIAQWCYKNPGVWASAATSAGLMKTKTCRMNAIIPLAIIRIYRLIPPRMRDAIFTSTGASTRALADIAAGGSAWGTLWRHGGLVFGTRRRVGRSWTDPGPQGSISAAWKLGEGGRGAP